VADADKNTRDENRFFVTLNKNPDITL